MEFIGYLLTGASAAAAIKLIDNIIQWCLARKAKKDDKKMLEQENTEKTAEERLKDMERNINSVVDGQRYILLDRIRHLGSVYLKNGEVSFDDRRLLNLMHGVYHNGLHGNGDLDSLMKEVNELPLKQ